ncbi:MAG TPA: ABC transporter ATP-binding protein [Candidatus Blautia faecavium]|uniref:ABC transporter ATP-binding protein n=1 Tax=Candidatus Blautia faecavium TaxID=2838487 RepID=A0A9D2RW12_9FIRM|nr:ABC transporter ATP-binding protein [Candidatus Blautia faecavium]
MEERYAIEVKDLVISYRNLKKTSIKQNLLKFKRRKAENFVAVKGISFYVREGEILGIIGKNGSGKSTTLNALAGIFSPDSGTIDLKGHSISLLSIGVGFQKEMTGRENIMLSGMLLGFTEQQIKEKEQEIIDFAGLGKFIDMPVRTYSSGMHSKLAFSITAILETDIMLIDEVLSVGDQKFKKKSYNKMKSLISSKERTVVIVSHSLSTLEQLCDTVMWMHEGEIKKIGDPKEVLAEYVEFMEQG